jgi:catechol 2,3-dioxygenase-like lactoylglutathione lyase family enzyme
MARAVRFYNEILGLEIIYGGTNAPFSSLRTRGAQDAILNLEQGTSSAQWGRVIFHVKDVDEIWGYLRSKGFNPARPRDAAWGERYFHLEDPDGHELSIRPTAEVSTRQTWVRSNEKDQRFSLRWRRSAALRMAEGFVEKASAISARVRRVGLFVPRSNCPR